MNIEIGSDGLVVFFGMYDIFTTTPGLVCGLYHKAIFIPDLAKKEFLMLHPGLIKTYFGKIFISKKCIVYQEGKINILFIFVSVNK